jgi:hypothetical protein
MTVTDTILLEKCCSTCGETKIENMFIPKRNVCKECRNSKSRHNYQGLNVDINEERKCNICDEQKPTSSFIKNRQICKICNNNKRRIIYKNDDGHRQKLIKMASDFKSKRLLEKKIKKKEEIGMNNKKCSCCDSIKPKLSFRHNRLKCKDCERDEPNDKIKRVIRSRIISALYNKKNKHTIEYLGMDMPEYSKWLLHNNLGYTLENRGKQWHIDHVIPLSRFNLGNEEQQLIAFNWRNTMPLSCNENLKKGNKISKPQIEQHLEHLKKYHVENELDLPQVFIDLFAKHLDAGNP